MNHGIHFGLGKWAAEKEGRREKEDFLVWDGAKLWGKGERTGADSIAAGRVSEELEVGLGTEDKYVHCTTLTHPLILVHGVGRGNFFFVCLAFGYRPLSPSLWRQASRASLPKLPVLDWCQLPSTVQCSERERMRVQSSPSSSYLFLSLSPTHESPC